jgi:hypothetical protein
LWSLLFQICYHMSSKSFSRNIKRHRKNLVENRILAIVKQETLLMIIFNGWSCLWIHCAHSQRCGPPTKAFGVKKLCIVFKSWQLS